ncbi:glutamate receptor 2-like [Portunus trituberculatus]|uniref:glutamate receptor 2-like n=1 Tax=Portunus trituberculatus TaxID=210409 RepID=UPI001E1CFC27|nr:glutamate receptor 2-like [Portunus trituberculatus]
MAVVVSQEPEFLTAFAEWSLKGRLLVWSTRLVVVTRLLLPQLQALLPTYWTFSMMNTVFLNVEKKSSIITFHGAMVNVTPMPFMPHWRTVTPEGSSIPIHEGSDYELLMAVAATLNFSIRTVPCNSWAEATRLVEERISLMCPIYHNKLTVRAEKYDFSFTYEFSFLSFAMAKPTQRPRWQSLYYPLSHEVWLIVLATVFFVPVVYISVNFVQQAIHGEKLWSAGRVFQDMAGLILGQSLPYEVSWFTSNRILLAAWLVFVIVFGSVYKGNLTAHLTLPKYPSRPETLKELVETVDKVTMPDYGESFLKYFRRSNSPLFIALGNLMELGPNAVEGLQRALRAKEAHVSGRRYLKYQVADKFGNEDGTNRLYVGRETVFPGHSGWPIPHDAPYSEQLDNSIMAVLEAGLYEKWTSDILAKTIMERKRRLRQPQQGDHQKDSAPKKSSQSLTITHTQGAFILLLLGLILSTITFAAEMKFP